MDWEDSIKGKELALQASGFSLILKIAYGSLSPAKEPEYRTKSKP